MELILIGEDKLKIMLSAEDMSAYELDCDEIDYDNTETRKAFWSILDEAKHKTGFDAASHRVLIQVYPSKSGGCELYVTKVTGAAAYDVSCSISRKAGVRSNVYCFTSMNDLLDVCKHLAALGYSGESNAYTDISTCAARYYLTVNGSSYSFIEDYGTRRNEREISSYITEHCRIICTKNAVPVLSKLSC